MDNNRNNPIMDSENFPYSEPELTNEIVYSNDQFQVRKVWNWNVNSLYEDQETGLLKVLISGQAFNWYGKSVFADVDGKRLTSLTFDYIDNFKEGLACVAINGYGYGYVNKDMAFVIPMIYDEAEGFNKGRAQVKQNGNSFSIDKLGKELASDCRVISRNYQEVGPYFEGLCRVSILKLCQDDLAYHSDDADIAGIWGFMNENGDEVIAPQYIYACDFEDGIAIVAKGKWTVDPDTGLYSAEEELWGGIDSTGVETIPCVFDEIKFFEGCSEYYIAHYGGWKSGNWGVIDRYGNWAAEPVFADIGYEYRDGLFAFYESSSWDDKVPMGIYDIHQKKVLFEPQFLDVSFLDDGDICVEVFDPELGRRVEKIIDRNGKERFKSVYSSIYTWCDPYEVEIRDDGENKNGLIDSEGNVIVPCVYSTPWNGFDTKNRRIIFSENGYQGIKNFDGETIIPAIYYEIHGKEDPLLTVRVGKKGHYKEGLITSDGTMVIDAAYKRIAWCKDKRHFFCCGDDKCEMYLWEEKKN